MSHWNEPLALVPSLHDPLRTTPILRSQEEIFDRAVRSRNGYVIRVLLWALDSPRADRFLDPKGHGKHRAAVTTSAHVLAAAKDVTRYCWGLALDHQGHDLERHVIQLRAWLWLHGLDDDQLSKVLPLNTAAMPFRAPQLLILTSLFGWLMPDDVRAVRMADGRPCITGCEKCDDHKAYAWHGQIAPLWMHGLPGAEEEEGEEEP